MKNTAGFLDLLAAAYLQKPNPQIINAVAAMSGRTKPESLAMVRLEHAELFLIPGTSRYVPPYESLIREGRLGGEAAAQTRRIFSDAGFDIKSLDADPHLTKTNLHDHLGFGLAFTSAQLWRSMLASDQSGDCLRTACEFFKQKIATWAPEYGRRLADLALTKHFADLGRFTAGLDDLIPELCRNRKYHRIVFQKPVPA